MSNRQRMTWAAQDRKASAAPAIPGYGVEDQDHPAHTQDDPGQDDYNIGGPSEFGEDVFPPPYGDSGAPAIPGYGVEDQDHPAHAGQVGRKANDHLLGQVRKKASKALKLAQYTLKDQKNATWASIEDQAFNFMSMDDSALDASLKRCSGGFLAEEQAPDMLADGMPMEDIMGQDDESPLMARMKAMEEELTALKRQATRQADQNDPSGDTLGTSGKSEEQEKAEEKAVSGKAARAKLARLFTACDLDQDGFVTEDDWMGPADVFAALDTDKDGIIAKHEVMAGEVPEAFKKQWDKGDDKKDDEKDEKKDDEKKDDKEAKKAALAQLIRQAKKLAEEIEDAKDEDEDKKESGKKAKKADDDADADDAADDKKESGKKASDDEDEDDKKESGKKASKKSDDDADEDDTKEAKKAFGHLADFDDDELDMLQAMQYGADEVEDVGTTACGDVMASKKSDDDADEDDVVMEDEDEGSEDSDKEASFFAMGFDPMGLSDGTTLTAADKAAFEEVFGKQGSEDEDADDAGGDSDPEEEDKAEKEANKRLASLLRPQPRKASKGVKSVGAVPKTASGSSEMAELADLWTTDPDVSSSFS